MPGGGGVRREMHRAVLLRLLRRLAGEVAGHGVVGRPALDEVHGHHGKLQRAAALEEEHLMRVGHVQDGLELGLRVVEDLLELFTSMAHLHNGQSAALIIHQILLRLPQRALGQHRGAGGEIEHLFA